MKSLDRLKEFVEEDAVLAEMAEDVEDEISELQESWAQEAREHADDSARLAELAHEIAKSYIKLPVDADGMPIHVGDYLQLGDTRGEVVAFTYCPAKGELPWEWQCDTGDWYNTAFAYHVKPRTIEDVLLDVIEHAVCPSNSWDEIIAKYADEIRELMGVS